jgi:peroxin-5
MQGGIDCNAAGAMSHAMQHALAGAAMGGDMHMHHAMHDAMHDDGDEAWAHDFVMHAPQAAGALPMLHHHHAVHHGAQHHFDPMQENWGADYQHYEPTTDTHVDDEHLARALENAYADAELEAAYAQESDTAADWMDEFHAADGTEWANEFADEEVKVFGLENEPLRTVEEKDAASEFHALMRDIQNGAVAIEENGKVGEPANGLPTQLHGEEDWTAEFDGDHMDEQLRAAWEANAAAGMHEAALLSQANAAAVGNDWTAEYDATAEDAVDEAMGGEDYADEFLEQGNDDWVREYEALTKQRGNALPSTDYPFEANNPYLFHDDPFMEAHELLAAGTLSEAVLAFEAACQKDPKAVEHWQCLGSTQAENEKDGLAIIALNNAIKLCPTSLPALSALAVSHTNEANHALAIRALRDWIAANEHYQGVSEAVGTLDIDEGDTENHFIAQYLFVNPAEHRQAVAMYEAALEMNPADVELHKALGVLHNLSNQYDKAAENFRNALRHAPEDEKLWNRLGATLANGSQPRDAIQAYNRALDLSPGFVRAQYNLGVAYSNIGDHTNAAKQFLRAIVMQQGTTAPPEGDGPPRSTREVWDMLRLALNMMERSDLVDGTWSHDVRPFLAEFGLQDLL